MRIITKFTVGTEQGINDLMQLTSTIATEKYVHLLSPETLENYLSKHFNEDELIREINSLSNQWLVVYANDKAVGYARLTTKGERPTYLSQQRLIRIADFGILQDHKEQAIKESLLDKCVSVSKSYDLIWINEYLENPLVSFFEQNGFCRENGVYQMEELPLASTYLIKRIHQNTI
ncbi:MULTISPECIES: GNAT family N-acetyltransferase [Olivibacter]|uniref:GNAT family N-acetyltransferase n=2 Tax=Olivibacter TaxID=376469 RepID=A0ABV6HNS0_9SPHI|nr:MULTISPECIES: GNAT family N-acetyltransferase [Olivibacter]MCL4639780.1 N-acetyltransferase [Olivibacter sp. UJ_SKK_5.1]MDM8173544.1 N-acetyltransferase [Olivibacter sp. 47]QEL03262.1 N-acetyltransferase [Olivibacter sp. LS-1]